MAILNNSFSTHQGLKPCPGLFVHAVPTDLFRNQFVLQASSECVAQKISTKILGVPNTNDIQQLDEASEGNTPFEFAVILPMLRTFGNLEKLAAIKGMNNEFIPVLRADLEMEKDTPV